MWSTLAKTGLAVYQDRGLTKSASRLGVAIINSTVVGDVQFLRVRPEGLAHGHVDVMAVHAPPHQLLVSRAQTSAHMIHPEAFEDPRSKRLLLHKVHLSMARAKNVLQ